MNGWDVLNSAISLVGGGAIAWRVAKATHSYQSQQDRRHRRQDTLEKLVDEFQAAHAACCHLIAAYIFLARCYDRPQDDPILTGALKDCEEHVSNGLPDARRRLATVEGRLRLIKLNDCADELSNYRALIGDMIDVVEKPLSKDSLGDNRALIGRFEDQAHRVVVRLADAFEIT